MKMVIPSSKCLLAVVACMWLSACTQPLPSTAAVAADRVDQIEPLKFAYVSPDPIGNNPFLKLGKVGLEQAGTKYEAAVMVLESHDPQSREENVRAAIEAGSLTKTGEIVVYDPLADQQ
jgi:hypothetical protein